MQCREHDFPSDSTILGSMADVPQDLLEQIQELEKLFTVDQAKLKEVTEHFVKELAKGKFGVEPVGMRTNI